MKKLFLSLLLITIGAASAYASCNCATDIRLSALTKSLTTCETKTEVIIYNAEYGASNFSSMSLSDSENFKLDVNYGSVPCGATALQTRGYEFCTVGVEFTPVTTSGTFSTTFQTTNAAGQYTTEITGEIVPCNNGCGSKHHGHKHHKGLLNKLKNKFHKSCGSKSYSHKSCGSKSYSHKPCGSKSYSHKSCGSKSYSHKSCGSKSYSHKSCGSKSYSHKSCGSKSYSHKSCSLNGLKNKFHKSCGSKNHGHKSCHSTCGSDNNDQNQVKNYLAGLNLISPTCSSNVYVDNGTLVFNEYNSNGSEGFAQILLDEVANSSTMLTFDADMTGGLVMPIMYSDTDSFMTTDVRYTKRYGFIFPNNALKELKLATWGQNVSGSFSNMLLVDYTNADLLP